MNSEPEKFVQVGDHKILVGDVLPAKEEGKITDERLPHRFGNRKQRRKLQSEIKRIKNG